jgi:hypothetical protein
VVTTDSSSACAGACSGNAKCKMWVWRLDTKQCRLKQTIYWVALPDQFAEAGLPVGRRVCLPACSHGDCVKVDNTTNACACDAGWANSLVNATEPRCTVPVCAPPCLNGGKCVDADTCDCAGTGYKNATCNEGARRRAGGCAACLGRGWARAVWAARPAGVRQGAAGPRLLARAASYCLASRGAGLAFPLSRPRSLCAPSPPASPGLAPRLPRPALHRTTRAASPTARH